MIKVFCYIIILFFYFSVQAQNLVLNGSFEEFSYCPKGPNKSSKNPFLPSWYLPSYGTSDYYNSCDKSKKSGVPKNRKGYIDAKNGKAYVGILFYSGMFKNSKEYIMGTFSSNLKENEVYQLSFYIRNAPSSVYETNELGVYFTNELFQKKNIRVLKICPQLKYKGGFILDSVWIKICFTYQAKGTEKYFIIGNFTKDKEMDLNKKVGTHSDWSSYYFIDNVEMTLLSDSIPCHDKDTKKDIVQEFSINAPIILKNLTFPTNSSIIDESSYSELDSLQHYLEKNPKLKIELSGYTDNVGKEQDNLLLSQARAKAVAEYLISKGIETERVSYKGYGSQHPISTNETEEGRKQNRRVEFKLYE